MHLMQHIHIVALDPGHGGHNRGCLGVDGTYEKTLALDLAKRVARVLTETTSAAVLLTRSEDRFVGLRERTRMANRWNADIFLSLHLNADPFGQGRGVETWFLSPDAADDEAQRMVTAEEGAYGEWVDAETPRIEAVESILHDARIRAAQAASETLAATIVDGLAETTKAPSRGAKQARFGVLKEARMPAVVVECGFFSHTREGTRLLEPAYQEAIAQGIVDGIVAFDRRIGGGTPVSTASVTTLD